jgi:hypothetical protein
MASDVSTRMRRGSTGWARDRGRWLRRGLLVIVAAWGVSEVPRAALGLETLVLSIAQLRYDNSPNRSSGALKIRALVDDNSTMGQLQVGLLAGTVALEISDAGQFSVLVPITGCKLTPSESVRCRSADGSVRANFIATAQGPYIYNMRVLARRLPDTQTGTVRPVGPVGVVLHQPGGDRPDAISACQPISDWTLLCREL